jgi:hypothetical protein
MKPHRVSMEQEIALHGVSEEEEEEIMLWKVSQITRKQLSLSLFLLHRVSMEEQEIALHGAENYASEALTNITKQLPFYYYVYFF